MSRGARARPTRAAPCWSRPIRASPSTIPGVIIPSGPPGSTRCWPASAKRRRAVTTARSRRARRRRAELERVHAPGYLDELERVCAAGGGALDADTSASAQSWEAALLAAGRRSRSGRRRWSAATATPRSARCVRPGTTRLSGRAMGFCLLNNVAVTAACAARPGRRVLVVDWDAHHGNGTQDDLLRRSRRLYVSMHEWPLYPGTGRLDETGFGPGCRARR